MDNGAEPILDPEQALIQFKQDERYRDFFSEDFEVGKYIQHFLSETKKNEFLASSLFQLDQLIKLQIAGGKESLLREAGALETAAGLDQSVREVSHSVTQLQSHVTRVAAQLTGPAQLLATRTRQLPRVQEASHVLRRVGQYVTLWKKLSALQSSSGESEGRGEQLIRAAQYLVQCDQLGTSAELRGVHVIEKMQLQLTARKSSVMEQAIEALMKGIELRSHHVISPALLVFHHFNLLLDMLHLCVHVIAQDLLTFIAAQLGTAGQHKVKHHALAAITPEMQALFVKSYQSHNAASRADPRPPSSPGPRAASHVTGSIWSVLGKISDKIEDKWSELITVTRAVVRLHVPDRINANIVSLLAEQLGHESRDFELDTIHVIDELLVRSFWKSFSTHFSEMVSHVIRVKSVNNASPMQYEALALDYPRVYALLSELSLKIDAQFDQVQVRTKTSKQSRDTATRLLREVFVAAESEYHTTTRNTVFRAVELFCNKLAKLAAVNTAATVAVEDAEKCPYLPELLQCSHVIKQQLIDKCLLYPTSLDGAESLAQRLVKTVCSALRPLATKISEAVARDTSINQGSDGVTWHTNHVILHNSVVQFVQHTRDTVLATYSAALMQPLRESIDQIEHVINQMIMEPIFSRFTKNCEKTLLMVQKAEFNASTDSDATNNSFVSPYMKLLKRQLQQFKMLLDKLMQTPFIVDKVRATQVWLTELFLRHVSLLPPLEGSGKLTLTGDIAQFEVGVMALFTEPCAQLQWIKWFKQLLFRDSAEISGTLPEVTRLPPSLVWHHLLSRLGAERPPSVLNKSVAQWLEYWSQHGEEELWRVAVKCLEQYQSVANKTGLKQFSPLLPVTLALGPQLVAAWHVNK